MDLIDSEKLYSLLQNRYVLLCGDSVMRSIYKDLILLVQGENRLLTQNELKAKLDDRQMENLNDCLIAGGKRTNDTTFFERRCYLTKTHMIKFVFLTRCFSGQMKNELMEIANGKSPMVDVLILNSAIWDITKYETNSEKNYAENLEECFRSIRRIVPASTVVIWLTAMPFSRDARAVLDETQNQKKNYLRLRILEVNRFSSELAKNYNFQVIDLHYLVRRRVEHRCADGMHYDALIHREITTKLSRTMFCAFHQSPSVIEEKPEEICRRTLDSMVRRVDTFFKVRQKRKIRQCEKSVDLQGLNEKEKSILFFIDSLENKSEK